MKTFLFRIFMLISMLITLPIWLLTLCVYWAWAIFAVILILPLSWILFGSIGSGFVKEYLLDLGTYHEMLYGTLVEHDIHDIEIDCVIAPQWYFWLFEWLTYKYKSINQECPRYK